MQSKIKVLGGPFDWQSASSSTIPQMQPDVLQVPLCAIKEDTFQCAEPEDEIPQFITQHLLSSQPRREPLSPS